jgi:hypothetical protein
MTQLNHTPTWTEKHLRYCIAQRLTPTAIKLYQWLLGEMREGYAETIDLRDFQKMVAKERGKAHDFRVVQEAIKRLVDAGILRTIKRFTNFVWKWTVRPINRLIYPIIPKPKNPQSRSQSPNLQRPNSENACQDVQAAAAVLRVLPEELTSDLEVNLGLLEEAGISFDAKDIPEILAWQTPDDIKKAIAHFNKRGSHSKIDNAEGWMRQCLEHRWWERKKPALFTEVVLNLAQVLGVSSI